MFVRTESFQQFLRLYPIISIIIAIQLAIYLIAYLPSLSHFWVLEHMGGVNFLIQQGEYWRLFTPILTHVGLGHLFFNSFSLILFGPALERALGKILFLTVYFVSGIGANIATFFIKPPDYLHIGASGAIFGLFGVYLAIILTKKDSMPAHGRQVILPLAAISVIITFFQPQVNVTAHIFGLIGGFLIGKIILQMRNIRF